MHAKKISEKPQNKNLRPDDDVFYKAHTELLEMVLEARPIAEIFDRTAKLIESISPEKTWCLLKLASKPDFRLTFAAAPSLPESIAEEMKRLNIDPDDGTCGQAVMLRKTIICKDIATDPICTAYQTIAEKSGIVSCWSVPVLDLEKSPLAVITLFYHRRYTPTETEVERVEKMCRLIRLAIERQRASEEISRSNEKFKSAAAATNDAVWDWDIPNNTLWWGEGFSHLFGFEGKDCGPSLEEWRERIHPDDRERIWNSLNDSALGTDRHWTGEYRFKRNDGEIAYVLDQAEVIFDSNGKAERMIGGMSDLTPHRKAELEFKTLNRAFEMLSSCNKTLIRANDEQQLLTDICAIATEVGGYKMAWVGFADLGPEKRIIPAAHVGDTDNYLGEICLSYNEADETGNGPAARTIRSGQAVICEDIRNESDRYHWKNEALKRGFRSLVCLPLKEGEHCFGFFNMTSTKVSDVGEDEKNLLQELADNLAYGITSLRSHKKQKTTQDTVVKVAKSVSASFGKHFYNLLTKNMVEALSATAGLIGKINPGDDSVTSLAMVWKGILQDNVTYSLKGTPCEQVISKEVCIFDENLSAVFPDDHYLIERGIQAYAGIALYNTQGEPVGILSVLFDKPFRDTSFVKSILQIFAERAASEMAREDADARIFSQASLLDKARDAIFTCDLEHRITYWNKSAERLYGFSREDAMRKSAMDLIQENTDAYDTAFATTMQTGEWIGELHQINGSGKPLIVESRWNLVRDSDGQPGSILAINTDVTEHRNLELQFLRAQRLESIGTLAGGLAHDLNNVLAPIAMSVELLRKSVSDSRGKELLDTLGASSKRGAEMIAQILSFARGVEGKRIPVSGKKLIGGLSRIISDTFPKDIRIETVISGDLWPVNGDSTQLHQVFLNLCVNARDAMPDGGLLSVSASNENLDETYSAATLEAAAGPYVRITVEDTGHGIAPDIMDKIYDPFFTTKEIGKGTGLGLSTTIAIIKSHGGFITCRSAKEKGSQFCVYLPSIPGHIEDGTFLETQSPRLPRGSGENILIIDDEPLILEITRQTLEEFGYNVVTANSGEKAIEYYQGSFRETDAIITDMMMPGLDGSKTIRALCEINPAARIIAVSGIQSNCQIAEEAGKGVCYFLQKPFTADDILTALEKLFQK